MKGHGAKFGRKKEEAIAALLAHVKVEEAARSVGVTAKTLRRWMDDPEFDAAYSKARRQAYSHTVARLQQGSSAAATSLMKLMLDVATPAPTRARCAEAIIHFAARAVDTEDIELRLSTLEQMAEKFKHGSMGK
jgi:hypothetical protein